MARLINRLTARAVASQKVPGLYADGGGLYLRVDSPTSKRWVFIFRLDATRREMGLGSVATVDLVDARAAAKNARGLVLAKINPITARKASGIATAGEKTFGEFCDDLVEGMKGGDQRPEAGRLWERTARLYLGPLRGMSPGAIETEHVLEALKPIWQRIPRGAAVARGHIEHFLDAAKARDLRSGENPARWRGHLALLLPATPTLVRGHHRALPAAEVAPFMSALRSKGTKCASLLEFTILTASRLGEARGARWDELDLEGLCWNVPEDRMKARRPHRVPLSAGALAVIESMEPARKLGPLVFPGNREGQALSHGAVGESLEGIEGFSCTIHGFRSTFRDWVAEHTDYSSDIAEIALAHTVGSQVERAYRRGDMLEKRRPMMEDWSAYCAT